MNVEATGRCLTCGQPVTAHVEEYVKEVRTQKVQAHVTGQAVQDERLPRQMCGG